MISSEISLSKDIELNESSVRKYQHTEYKFRLTGIPPEKHRCSSLLNSKPEEVNRIECSFCPNNAIIYRNGLLVCEDCLTDELDTSNFIQFIFSKKGESKK